MYGGNRSRGQLTERRFVDIWSDLVREANSRRQPAIISRLVISDNSLELHLAISSDDKRRLLMIRMPDSWDMDIGDMPQWIGARVDSTTGKERPVPHRFLNIEQGPESSSEVFEALIEDLCHSLELTDNVSIIEKIKSRLSQWSEFFSKRGLNGLTPMEQLGLFGELRFIRDYLIPVLGYQKAIESWNFTKKANHDFQIMGRAIEVKSTGSKEHLKFHVSSEKQLETEGISSLHIVFLAFNIIHGGGVTLPQIIDEIRNMISQNRYYSRLFEEKLIDEGYLDIHEWQYRFGYLLRNARAFQVSETFPRILAKDLKPGIGDVSYSVVLSACERFRVEIEDAVRVFAVNGNGNNQ